MAIILVQAGLPPAPPPDPRYKARCPRCGAVYLLNLSDADEVSLPRGPGLPKRISFRCREVYGGVPCLAPTEVLPFNDDNDP